MLRPVHDSLIVRQQGWWAHCLAAALVIQGSPARSETLAEAIAFTYQSNPVLQSQRAQLRAVDETFVQARSAYGPSLQVQATASYNQDRLRDSFSGGTALPSATTRANLGSARVVLDQPLYSGGRTTLEVRSAEQRVRAARETLRISEQNVIFAVIEAYADVLRDQQALAIRRENIDALAYQLQETQARWRAGEVTRTDVAQAEAQLASEQASFAVAENQLQTSRNNYATVVGRNPGSLFADEPPLPGIPRTPQAAFDLASTASPELQQASHNEQQSRTGVAVARTIDRPTVSLRGSYGYSATLDPLNGRNRDRALTGEAVVSIPLFSAGRTSSQIRQALELNTSDRLSIESTRRSMVQNIANAWNEMVTFQANIAREETQVTAATLAFKGMRIEYRAGQRSTLDVLIAEETLRDAELAELAARHDAYLAEALVLRYVGHLEARDLVEGLPQYDPAEHFRKVAHKGAMPWEPLVRALDAVRVPDAGQRTIPAPDAALGARMAPPAAPHPSTALIAAVPVAPVPGTVSNVEPPSLADGDR